MSFNENSPMPKEKNVKKFIRNIFKSKERIEKELIIQYKVNNKDRINEIVEKSFGKKIKDNKNIIKLTYNEKTIKLLGDHFVRNNHRKMLYINNNKKHKTREENNNIIKENDKIIIT